MPATIVLVEDTRGQADSLAGRLMIIDKLDLGTAGLVINHTRASRDAHNYLLIKRAADRALRQFVPERGGSAKDAASGAAHVLTIDKEAIITPRHLQQRLIDRAQHRQLAFCPTRRVLLPGRDLDHMLHHACGIDLRLLEDLGLSAFNLALD